MKCSHWEEDNQVIILDESVIFSFVEGTATLGWPKKEAYINFYETEGKGDGEAEEIMKFENGCDGKVNSRHEFLVLFTN
jgi:hypothetical protein